MLVAQAVTTYCANKPAQCSGWDLTTGMYVLQHATVLRVILLPSHSQSLASSMSCDITFFVAVSLRAVDGDRWTVGPQDVVIVNRATTEDRNTMFELYVLLDNGQQVLDVNSLKEVLEVCC